MAKFVNKDRVAVTIDGDPNAVYIRPKMDFGTNQKVFSAMARISAGVGSDMKAAASVGFDIGAYNIALMQHNILGWEGPDFNGIRCTPEAILELDQDDPLVQKVLETISERNSSKGSDPNASTPSGDAG